MHHRYIILVLMAFLTLLVDVAIADVAHHHDSLSEKAMKTSAVTMKSDSIIECNTLIVANDLRSGDITPLQTEQIDKTDGWPLSWKIFATFIYPIITLLIGVWIKTAISSRAEKDEAEKPENAGLQNYQRNMPTQTIILIDNQLVTAFVVQIWFRKKGVYLVTNRTEN